MERTVWTDGRLDDRFGRIDQRLDRIEDELRAIRGEIAALRRDMFNGFLVMAGLIVASWGTLIAHNL